MTHLLAWGHNPGQFAVKDTVDTLSGKRSEAKPYPAVIAPFERGDDIGVLKRSTVLEATVDGARYLGGMHASRLPTAIRQMSNGRLDADSPIYSAFIQMSYQALKLTRHKNAQLVIATAMPVSWRSEDADHQMESFLRAGLRRRADIRAVYVRSEPAAVIYHELLTDDGEIRRDQQALTKNVVCVGDIGGGTLNRSVLEQVEVLPGQAQSPALGSRQAIEVLSRREGLPFTDAEQRLRAAVLNPGADRIADTVLRQYGEAVIAELKQAWQAFKPAAYLFAGGTTYWIAPMLKSAFGAKARILDRPQQAIATGLYRYAKRKVLKP